MAHTLIHSFLSNVKNQQNSCFILYILIWLAEFLVENIILLANGNREFYI